MLGVARSQASGVTECWPDESKRRREAVENTLAGHDLIAHHNRRYARDIHLGLRKQPLTFG